MILALLATTVCGVAYAIDPAYVNNIYMATTVCVVVFMLIVFCSDFQSSIWFGLACCYSTLTCELGELWDIFKSNITLILLYPILVVCTPLIIILMKLRVIFPADYFLKTQKTMIGLAESSFEATPQLALQLYIIFSTIDQEIPLIQKMVIASSSLSCPSPQ